MQEIRPIELNEYLQRQKKDGYCLVGVEQSNESISLDTVQFPDKVILVLGKEKEGVPADILHLLDMVVEIPQVGIVR